MPRRVSLPEADDLFRPTVVRDASVDPSGESGLDVETRDPAEPKPTGRVRHDEKMTVYISSDELLDIEDARIALRRRHGLAADRGRVVRAAVALALVDLEKRGEHSDLVTLLRQQ
ncbi:hypothetical protein KLP28_16915 [Nocardioidaceae bacterium]|nr:hypothetical protein KLP28_16915 [Nocardioidaceae bacterium]